MRRCASVTLVVCVALLCGCAGESSDTSPPRFPSAERPGKGESPGAPGADLPGPGAAPDEPSSSDPTVDIAAPALARLVVDQFGYLPKARKVALLRDPHVGFDAGERRFVPDPTYHLVELGSGERRLDMHPIAWNGGAVDPGSGDRVWWLDFSEIEASGDYRIETATGEVMAGPFRIAADVYDELLVQALRTFFYQRAGHAKALPYADARWADAASHLGPGQDTEARRYDTPDDPDSARDLSGGWYDAGDYNRYTRWTANYLIEMLHAWEENPAVWTDDFGLPDSGNGIPDLVDEILWGLDWLVRMQEPDGSVLSILDVDEASPPSSARGPSRYGPPSTSATLAAAAAYAYAASRFAESDIPALEARAADLIARAELAWDWAEENPAVVFRNNDVELGTEGIGAGQQETDERGRERLRLSAAIYLAEATGDQRYRGHVSHHLPETLLVGSRYASPFDVEMQRDILFHRDHETIDPFEVERIGEAYVEATEGQRFWSARGGSRDAYLSYLDEYVWGSNGFRAKKGLMYLQRLRYDLGERSPESVRQAALDHLHYLHGLNPLGLVFLTNTAEYGAERSVGTLYHRWFVDGSPRWDSVTRSTHGPLPGFLVGGPNPAYRPASCCPASCPVPEQNARCRFATGSPFVGEPPQKAFAEWNEGFPLDSWQMTENSNGYQASYLRLLGWFVSGG